MKKIVNTRAGREITLPTSEEDAAINAAAPALFAAWGPAPVLAAPVAAAAAPEAAPEAAVRWQMSDTKSQSSHPARQTG